MTNLQSGFDHTTNITFEESDVFNNLVHDPNMCSVLFAPVEMYSTDEMTHLANVTSPSSLQADNQDRDEFINSVDLFYNDNDGETTSKRARIE